MFAALIYVAAALFHIGALASVWIEHCFPQMLPLPEACRFWRTDDNANVYPGLIIPTWVIFFLYCKAPQILPALAVLYYVGRFLTRPPATSSLSSSTPKVTSGCPEEWHQKSSRFCMLPAEIRLMIYAYIFSNIKVCCTVDERDFYDNLEDRLIVTLDFGDIAPHARRLPLTCKKIYEETRHLVAQGMKFQIHDHASRENSDSQAGARRLTLDEARHLHGLPSILSKKLSTCTLENLRCITGIHLAKSPNSDIGRIVSLLPGLRICMFCAEGAQYMPDERIEQYDEIIEQYRSEGANFIFKQWSWGPSPRDLLVQCGVTLGEAGKDSGVQFIVALVVYVGAPDDYLDHSTEIVSCHFA